MGSYDEAIKCLRESLAIARELAEFRRAEACLQLLGLASLGCGDMTAARGFLEEAVVQAREQGNRREIAAAMNGLAQFHRAAGELGAAQPLYEEVLRLALEMADVDIVAIAKLNLAMVAVCQGASDRARPMLLDAIAIALDVGSRPTGQSAVEVTAGMAASIERWESSARFFGAAEAQSAETGLHRDPTDEAFLAPLIASARNALGPDHFGIAEATGSALSYEAALREAVEFLKGKD